MHDVLNDFIVSVLIMLGARQLFILCFAFNITWRKALAGLAGGVLVVSQTMLIGDASAVAATVSLLVSAGVGLSAPSFQGTHHG